MSTKPVGVYDARKELGMGRTLILGLQQCFAMFGATVLVPILSGLSVSVTLFCAGVATLWFHFITQGKCPIFLGSSFAFLGMYSAIIPEYGKEYATGGVLCAGALYVILALLIKLFGAKRVMKLFPPVVCGPLIILIGMNLSATAVSNASGNWLVAFICIAIIIICNIWGKGMIKICPVLISLVLTMIIASIMGIVDYSGVAAAKWVGMPDFHMPKFNTNAIVAGLAVAVAAMVEHIGDIAAIGATCGKNFIADPGLTRTLLGDGIGTSIAGLLGGPANTTYSENTGVVALTRVFDPFVMRVAACMAIILSLSPKFAEVIHAIPGPVIGGISFVLYGMISATGIRCIVENQVDYANMRNVLLTAIIMVSGLGFEAYPIVIGNVTFKGLACAAVFGIILNAILPGKDYVFKED